MNDLEKCPICNSSFQVADDNERSKNIDTPASSATIDISSEKIK